MPSPTRAEIITALPEQIPGGNGHWTAEALSHLTAEPVYAIPTDVLDLLSQKNKRWFKSDELQLERKLNRLCNNMHAVAIFQGRFIVHPFFDRPPMPRIDEAMMCELGWTGMTVNGVEQGLRDAKQVIDTVFPRREAFLGWLMTYPTFLAERDALRAKWPGAVSQLDGIPAISVRQTLELRDLLPAGTAFDLEAMVNDFTAFCERWDLLGMPTWDLPQPKVGNFGCPAIAGKLTGVDASPTVQLPRTLRLPARFPLDGLLNRRIDDHLAEWRAVEDERHPDKLSYDRLRQVFHLHFLRNVVIGSGYRDRFRRHVGLLDGVLAEYFGYDNEEAVRKLRQWIDRRLRLSPSCHLESR